MSFFSTEVSGFRSSTAESSLQDLRWGRKSCTGPRISQKIPQKTSKNRKSYRNPIGILWKLWNDIGISKVSGVSGPHQDFADEFPSYAHGLAFCLLQADVLEACCDEAQRESQRSGIIGACLRMLHRWGA